MNAARRASRPAMMARFQTMRRLSAVPRPLHASWLRPAGAVVALGAAGLGLYELRRQRRDNTDSRHAAAPEPPSTEEVQLTRAELKQRYSFQKRLGLGAFGEVWLATEAATGRAVAVKIMSLEQVPIAMARQEISAMRSVGRHPHTVELLLVSWIKESADSPKCTDVALVMEVAVGGQLFERLVSNGPYSERVASKIANQIALAVYHLHSRGVLHRDIKPENIVFKTTASDSPVALIDFGTATLLEGEGEKVRGGGRIGTCTYWAPEQTAQRPYGFAVDMWSVGIVLHLILAGYHPFDPTGTSEETVYRSNVAAAGRAGRVPLDGPEWVGISPEAKALVQSLLEPDPAARCTAAQFAANPWVLGKGVSARDLPATHERLGAFIRARQAFFGSVLLAGLVHSASHGDEGGGQGEEGWHGGRDFDVVREGWRMFDREGKGHINAADMRRVCEEMGYAVSGHDVANMLQVMSPTSALAPEPFMSEARRRRLIEKVLNAGLSHNAPSEPEPEGLDDDEWEGATLTYERYRRTIDATVSRTIDAGQYVFRSGDPVDAVFVILKGNCELQVSGPKGESPVLRLGPGDCCGQTALLEGRKERRASVQATTPLEVLVVGADVFAQLAQGGFKLGSLATSSGASSPEDLVERSKYSRLTKTGRFPSILNDEALLSRTVSRTRPPR